MAKIILVAGASNTGKTSSIRLFLEGVEIFHLKRRGDITVVAPIRRNKKSIALGVATGGDNLSVVKTNLAFISSHHWDVIVCASKSWGKTRLYVEDFARRHRAQLVVIETTRTALTGASRANGMIAAQVEQNLT